MNRRFIFISNDRKQEKLMQRIKYEARNPKSETNPKYECSKFKTKAAVYVGIYLSFWLFGFRSFEFVSNFDIRISDLFSLR
jgi:hypothetical protein